jgi:hypothetical protein
MTRLLWRAAVPAAARTTTVALGLLTLGGLGQALLATSASPPPALLLRLLLASAGAVAPLALGVGALAGAASAASRLAEDRALLGLGTLGVPASRLAPLFLAAVLPAALLQAALAHGGEPLARAALRDARAEALAAVTPRPDEAVRLGAWWVAAQGDGLAFTDGTRTGTARSARLDVHQGGVLARLAGVELSLEDGARATAERVALPVPVDGRGRTHAAERTTPDLLRQLRVSAALGRDGYERWLLWKRTLLPLALGPLAVAAAGFARRFRVGPVVGGLLFTSWVGVRILDGQTSTLSPALASALFLLPVLALAGLAWRR